MEMYNSCNDSFLMQLVAELDKWDLKFNPKMEKVQGRVMQRESIVFAGAGKPELVNEKADWTMAFRSRQMLSTVTLDRWVVFVPLRDAPNVENLIRTMTNVAKPLNFMIRPPLEM